MATSPRKKRAAAAKTGADALLDFDIQRCTRKCAATDRAFQPGESYYSVLQVVDGDVVRRDFSEATWAGPPQDCVGWWKSAMPGAATNRLSWAPNDVMLDLFARWAHDEQRREIRYVLALLLVRRRVLRLEDATADIAATPEEGAESETSGTPDAERTTDVLAVYCSRREESFRVPVAIPDPADVDAIQNELAQLLLARAA